MCSAKSFQLFAKVATCPARGSISKIAMLLCVITVRQHCSIAILLMDPRGIWLMKPNVFCKVFQFFTKVAMCPPRGSISKIAMLLRAITVRQHSSIAILLMDPRGIWLMKPNVFSHVFSTFHKSSTCACTRVLCRVVDVFFLSPCSTFVQFRFLLELFGCRSPRG